MKTKLRKNEKNYFEKGFLKIMYSAIFRKTVENVRKYRDTKLVTTDARKNYLVSEQSYHTTFFFVSENFLAIVMKNKNIIVFLGLSILEISKIVMYEFWYDYVKPKYGEKAKLCYMDGFYSLHKNRRHLQRHCKRC